MSISRYQNREDVLNTYFPQFAEVFSREDYLLFPTSKLVPEGIDLKSSDTAEIHIYSISGNYLGFDHEAKYVIKDLSTKSILIDLKEAFSGSKISNGSFRIIVNLINNLFGSYNDQPFICLEISPDRTECKLEVKKEYLHKLVELENILNYYKNYGILNSLVVNFGRNNINNISNFRVKENIVYFKFYNEIPQDITVKSTSFLSYEISDPYVDFISLVPAKEKQTYNVLKGPNFYLESEFDTSNATESKNWDDLLDTSVSSAQRVIDLALSSSGKAYLNIDYTDYNNFIFYSSAQERIKNFIYKLKKVEGYDRDNKILTDSTASSTGFVVTNVSQNENRKNQILNNFDFFERWLYYSPTSSLFTHDISGSLTPWPKYLKNGSWVNHHTTSSLALAWAEKNIASADSYDQQNYNRLWWTIPEHVLMDEGNSNYILFVEMIGHHFDILYSYVKALTQIHERDEHPERGPSNDLLYYIAKSLGWNLQNTNQLSDLWLYKLGQNQEGKFENTGSLFSKSTENQTYQIWRRIVNNLPYLYKTKGTERSVKALLSIYGIPQTLISIKEYGGPSTEDTKPNLIEQRFQYLLRVSGSRYVEFPRREVNINSGSWGGSTRVPDTVEFRFRSLSSSSLDQSLWAIEDGLNRSKVRAELSLVHKLALDGTASYSGSNSYGKLRFFVSESGYSPVYSDYLPLFDRDIWTVRIWKDSQNVGNEPINVQVSRASDNLYGRIPFNSKFSYVPVGNVSSSWEGNRFSPSWIVLGGTTSSGKTRFDGELQAYKEYFEVYSDFNFEQHVLNPSAYNVDNYSGSFYSLYRYYPLGVDVQRYDHSVTTRISSSHPNQDFHFDSIATFRNFPADQKNNYDQDVETYYINLPSVGGNNLFSNKIRIENNRLKSDLSTDFYSSYSEFDSAAQDRNRLAIVFSPSDHVNLDIFNHFGYVNLNNTIAGPDREFESEYPELDRVRREYWKKYEQINNANDLIRILGLYDYTFFDQIKQLTPGRADLITGVLIEPNILYRPKSILTRRPTVENPQYEKEIGYPLSQSGERLDYEAEFSASRDFTIQYQYLKTIVSSSFEISSSYSYIKTQFSRSYSPTGEYSLVETQISTTEKLSTENPIFYESILYPGLTVRSYFKSHTSVDQANTGIYDEIDMILVKFSGSKGETGSFAEKSPVVPENNPYYRIVYHYDPTGSFKNKYEREFAKFISQSYNWYSSRSLEPFFYQIPEDSSRNISRFVGSKISSAGINIDSPDTIDGGPVVTIIESNPNNLFVSNNSSEGNLKVE